MLEARMAPARQIWLSWPKTTCLTGRLSLTASTTRSTEAIRPSSEAGSILPSAAIFWSRANRSFPTSRSSPREIASMAEDNWAGAGSLRTTCQPRWAKTWAIPRPMVPAPAIPTRRQGCVPMDDFLENERNRDDRPRWGASNPLAPALQENRQGGAVRSSRQVYPGAGSPL